MEATHTTPTREQVEALKANWRGDPCWDIEDTEGFEAYRDELAAFSMEQHQIWSAEFDRMRSKERAAAVEKFNKTDEIDRYEVLCRAIDRIEELEAKVSALEYQLQHK